MSLFRNVARDFRRNKVLYFLAIPILVWYAIFMYAPMVGLIMAFQNFNPVKGITGSQWVGFKHFKDFFTGNYAWRVIRNTFVISGLDILIGFPAPIIFALLLNEVRAKAYKRVVQTISYMPHFISLVVMCGIIVDFTKSGGLISSIVASLTGTAPRNLLGDASCYRAIYIGTNIWQSVGYGSIIYIAALAGVDQELYEAATIDGAGRWKQTIHITLPGIASTIIIMLIMRMGQMLAVGSEKTLLLYSPATYETADVISTLVYRKGFQDYNYGFSTAVGLFNSVVNTTFLLITNYISRKYSETSLF